MVLRTLCSINGENIFETLNNCRVTEFEKKTNEGKVEICVYVTNQLRRGTSYSQRSLNFFSTLHNLSMTKPHGDQHTVE